MNNPFIFPFICFGFHTRHFRFFDLSFGSILFHITSCKKKKKKVCLEGMMSSTSFPPQTMGHLKNKTPIKASILLF